MKGAHKPYSTHVDAGRRAEEEDWRPKAACRREDPELFFPLSPDDPALAAKDVCRRCTVTAQCLAYVLTIEQLGQRQNGVWGGFTEGERRGRPRPACQHCGQPIPHKPGRPPAYCSDLCRAAAKAATPTVLTGP